MDCVTATTDLGGKDVTSQTKMSANTDHATSSLTVPTQWAASTAPVFRVMMETDSHVMISTNVRNQPWPHCV